MQYTQPIYLVTARCAASGRFGGGMGIGLASER